MGFSEELEAFVAAVVTPGRQHPWSFRIMRFALGGLAAVLGLLLAAGAGSGHHWALLGLTLGLWGLIEWFLVELDRTRALPPKDKEEAHPPPDKKRD